MHRQWNHEDEVARRWFALPPGTLLPLSDGQTCQLIFAGRGGNAVGPDVHDAVLLFVGKEERRLVGDIEFHVHASAWFAHGHHDDARYSNVILHVVLVCDTLTPIRHPDGSAIPLCSLQDIAQDIVPDAPFQHGDAEWPCHAVMPRISEPERAKLLEQAGMLRFEQKADTFVEQLHTAPETHAVTQATSLSIFDICLLLALAEGLGYGRDRAFFRAVGHYLLGLDKNVPEPLGHTADPPGLDARRLKALRSFIEQWHPIGVWETVKKALSFSNELLELKQQTQSTQVIQSLRTLFATVGTARADILLCNCVLPFALAVALIEHDTLLAERATRLYREYPSLSSNRITRAMQRQLLLLEEPHGACRQQGLHYVYQQTCREKRCEVCMIGKRIV